MVLIAAEPPVAVGGLVGVIGKSVEATPSLSPPQEVIAALRPGDDPEIIMRATQPPPGREQRHARAHILMDCRKEVHRHVRRNMWALPEHEAEEVTADIIALFVEKDALWEKYDRSKPFRDYVLGIAKNRALTVVRNVTRRSFLQTVYRAMLGDEGYLPDSKADLSRGVQHGEFSDERMQKALERLPKKTQSLIRAYYLHKEEHQPTADELADSLGTSGAAVRKQLERARKRLFAEYVVECAKEEM